ncbi:MAG: transposase [Bacilli bacterium]
MRTHYEREFKLELVKSIIKNEITVTEASKTHKIQRTTISRWVAEYKKYKNKAFTGNGNKLPRDAELEYLKQHNKQLEMENEILKKFEQFVKKQR